MSPAGRRGGPGGPRCKAASGAAVVLALPSLAVATGANAAAHTAWAAVAPGAAGLVHSQTQLVQQMPELPLAGANPTVMEKIYEMGRDLCEHRPNHESCRMFREWSQEMSGRAAPEEAVPVEAAPELERPTPALASPAPVSAPAPVVAPAPLAAAPAPAATVGAEARPEALDAWGQQQVHGPPDPPVPWGQLRRWGPREPILSSWHHFGAANDPLVWHGWGASGSG
mmetsp:Transcript_123292/g.343331  ORF Transcript_123292/g.343331 Transcript_123292/m.343331 type:complete len:226 (+) Transcript_123292:125-802(+)